MVTNLVKKGENIYRPDSRGLTMIQKLAQLEYYPYAENVFGFIVHRWANVNVRTPSGDNLLHLAARHNWPVVERLANLGFIAYEPDSEGLCVLHRLAQDSAIDPRSLSSFVCRVRVLCGNNSVHSPSTDSLLHLAAKHDNFTIMVEIFIAQDDLNIINQLDSEGLNVVHCLLQYQPEYQDGHETDSTLNTLLSMGANPIIRISPGDRARHLVAKHNKWHVIERLVAHGCDVNELDSEGFFMIQKLEQTPDGCDESFDLPEDEFDELMRLNKEAQPCRYEFDSEGTYFIEKFEQVAQFYDTSLETYFILLLEEGTDLSVLTPTRYTALHMAARHNNWNLVPSLIEQGCDMSTPDRLAQTAIEDVFSVPSIWNEDPWEALFLRLVDKGASPLVCSRGGDSVLHLAAKHGNWRLVNHLLELEVNINDLDSEGFSILHRLVSDTFINESISQLDDLITNGADINCKCAQIGTALHIFLNYGSWNLVKRLVELAADVKECDTEGMRVLHIITKQRLFCEQRGCISLIRFLIRKVRCPKGDSFLHVAAKHDNWEIVQQMISHTACNDEDVNENDIEGFTILHRAASRKTIMFTRSLFQVVFNKGEKCDIPCHSSECALHLAVKHGNWGLIKELLRNKENELQLNPTPKQSRLLNQLKGSQHVKSVDCSGRSCLNIDAKDASGNTILHLCAKQRKWDQVHKLLMSAADPGLTDDEGHTVLYRLAIEHHDNVKDHNSSKIFQFRSRRTIYTGEIDEFGDTLIQIAARNKNLDLLYILIYQLDHVNVADIDGQTLLHIAVQCKSLQTLNIVQILLKKTADIDVPCPKGDTALHLVAQSGNWDIVRELIRKGAKAGDTDSEGMSILHRLVRRTRSSCKSHTILGQCNNNDLLMQLVKLLVGQGADVNTKDASNLTPLQLAVIGSRRNMVQAVLEFGADVDRNAAREILFFHELAQNTKITVEVARSVTTHLLTRGLNLNERDSEGDTPLNLAAKHRNWRVVRLFAEVGADASIPDSEGWFVCHRLAMDRDCIDGYGGRHLSGLLSLLTCNGFEVNQKGPDGKSSLQTALKHKNWEMIWWLVQFGANYLLSLDEKKTILENVLQLSGTYTDQDNMKRFISHVIDKHLCTSNEMRREIALCEINALHIIIFQNNWSFAKTLVDCGLDISRNISDEPLLHFVAAKYFLRHGHTEWIPFLDALLARGVDINCRDKNGRTVLFRKWRRFSADSGMNIPGSLSHVLLDRGADPSLGDAEGISLLREALKLKKYSAIAAVKSLIELGVSTHQPSLTDAASTQRPVFSHSSFLKTLGRSPTQRAFEKNNVVAFKMLVESGASSNKELFELNTRYQVELSSKDSKSTAELEMLDILRDAASEPRSLKSSCRLTVSHALGCGPRRKEKVSTLLVPASLQNYILFCDVLSEDFQVSEAELDDMNFENKHLNFWHDRSLYLSQEYCAPYSYNGYYYDSDDDDLY